MASGAPKVTVIIPTYNRAPYLGAAIRSALDQTFTDCEIIVVDDGSTDRTAPLVRSFSDERLRYLHQPHRGVSAALNNGIRSARGAYIARLDSDDLWLPVLLARLVPVLDREPEAGVVYGMAQAIDDAGRPLAHTLGTPGRFPADSLRSLVYDDCTCNIALVARRECFERAGPYDETLIASEDRDMWLRVARHYRFAFIEEVMAHVRWHADNLTRPGSPGFEAILNTCTAPLDKLFQSPDLPPAVRALKSAAYANVYLSNGRRWLHGGRVRRAGREFGRALRVSDRRAATLARIVWFTLAVPLLQRSAPGRRAVWAFADLRRRRRRSMPDG